MRDICLNLLTTMILAPSNQTGVENKQFKWYQVREAFTDYKLYLFFLLGTVGIAVKGYLAEP